MKPNNNSKLDDSDQETLKALAEFLGEVDVSFGMETLMMGYEAGNDAMKRRGLEQMFSGLHTLAVASVSLPYKNLVSDDSGIL